MKTKILLLTLFITSFSSIAQVGINTDGSAPDASAMLDIKSNTAGMLIPRMTAAERDNITTPATGLMVYITDDNYFYYYDGTNWKAFENAGQAWLLNGNSGVTTSQFLGTTDAVDLIIKTNNITRATINSNGEFGLGSVPVSSVKFYTYDTSHTYTGYFQNGQTDTDNIGVVGDVSVSDYYGRGGVFYGGYQGVYAQVLPTGSNYYYGVYSRVEGGTGYNYGMRSKVSGDGYNLGAYATVDDTAGGANAINYGFDAKLTGDGKNYAFLADVSGAGTNYGFYGVFDVANGNGSIAHFSNLNANGIGAVANGNNLATYYTPTDGAGLVANGSLIGMVGYTDYDDANAIAVYGKYKGTTNTHATGIYGYSAPAAGFGYGVKGYGGYIGVYGETDANGYAGVYGSAPSNSSSTSSPYAIYANGDLGSSGAKNFLIDHPLDPENKFLKHFSLESDEILNMYRGNVILDNKGSATIKLPDYFMAINVNYSYVLTPVGNPAPNLYVAKEINNRGKFVIAGGRPGQKISWYVYAQRNDPYIQQHPEKLKVEVKKNAQLKGKYLIPELYHQPDSKAIYRPAGTHLKENSVKNTGRPKQPVSDVKKNSIILPVKTP